MSFNCAVRGCRLKEKSFDLAWGKKLRVTLHCKPKDPVLSKKWEDILHLWNHKVPKTFHVCSAHFNPESVIVQFGRTFLAPNSVPTMQDSTYLILNYVGRMNKSNQWQTMSIKVENNLDLVEYENVEYQNVEYLDFDNVGHLNEAIYETDPLNLYTVKKETESDDPDYQNTVEENGYRNDISSTKRQIKIEESFMESNSENHAVNHSQAIFSQPMANILRVEKSPPRTCESISNFKPKEELPYKPANLTNFSDCKLKLRRFDKIIKVLRLRNSRQTIRIMALEKNLAKLKNELKNSNEALALLMAPDFEFPYSPSSS